MSLRCPRNPCSKHPNRTDIRRHGQYFRSSDSKYIERWFCKQCKKTFSRATTNPCFGQKKRRINTQVRIFLESGVSMRQIARKLRIHRITVARKRNFWSKQGVVQQQVLLKKIKPHRLRLVQFDDLETFEHTKCKPLSVSLVVSMNRQILSFKVSQMPCKGRLAKKARKKYGPRRDCRKQGWESLFSELRSKLREDVVILSDQNPHYPSVIKRYFPKSIHRTVRGLPAARTGQGEMKKGRFDPLFATNHTFAKMRDLTKPLTRRSWCTVKAKWALIEHLNIFIADHNRRLAGYKR